MKYHLIFIILNIFPFWAIAQDITIPELKQHVDYLASDSLQGRRSGTTGGWMAATYIRDQFRSYGLELMGDEGFQYFEIVTDAKLGTPNTLSFESVTGEPGIDFIPFSYSGNGTLTSTVNFVGYGFDFSADSVVWDDYEGMDVSGQWVMILLSDPETDNPGSVFASYGDTWGKILKARDHGAAGIFFVTPVKMEKNDILTGLQLERSTSRAGIPVIHLSRKTADRMLSSMGKTIGELESGLNAGHQPGSFRIPVKVSATVNVIYQKARTQNVVAILRGSDPALAGEYIVVGAHYDHLGMGGPGSNSRALDTVAVHNGADDNASGVAGMLGLAEELTLNRDKIRRSVLFVAFDAEEMGLLGSKYFVDQSKEMMDKTDAMINMDMIGRFYPEEKPLLISGTGTSAESETLLDQVAADLDFKLAYSPEGYGASDHSSFYAVDIPVFFITSGAHDDYHMPEDDADRIHYAGIQQIVAFLYDLMMVMDERESALTFQEAGPKEPPRSGRGFKVTLGILPDFASTDNTGLRIDAVRKGGPADQGGLLKGDRIVALNGKTVTNIYDYMARLKELETGQVAAVEVIREGIRLILLVQL
ncbi:MAG: M20/M25/M40 family metallo-hydrolase [Bacteroidales bacterium]|nr:M20/M25/M40 family metallo-hydrolase [Lentimicrobiaceae bacterium]MDD5694610.1 M20/M25/M40 family metallo-hydrolase [Bacteroidales bacterium]